MLGALIAAATGLPKWVQAIGFGLAAGILVWGAGSLYNRNQQDIGAVKQRNADLERTIRNVDKADKAADDVRRNPDAARDECLRNARNPSDC